VTAVNAQPAARRRRLGIALMGWGGAGLAILALGLGVVNGALGNAGGQGLESQRTRIVHLIDASTDALADAEAAARNADGSLVSAAAAASSAGGFMTDLSASMIRLAASLRIQILGSQPFAQPADDFERVAGSAASVAADLQTAATAVRLGGEDMAALADELATMRTQVAAMRSGLENPIDLSRWRLVATVVLAWLAVPALVSLLVGFRWWRQAGPARLDGDPRDRRQPEPMGSGPPG
jgi:hypothetical protein